MGQSIVSLEAPASLTLHSSRGFNIAGASAGDTLATLTVMG